MTVAVLPEITVGRRAFPVAQGLFLGAPTGVAEELTVGWYDSSVNAETGSFAVVSTDVMAQAGSDLEDLIGEIVAVTWTNRTVYAYVLQDATLPAGTDVALYRRCYAGLSRLNRQTILAGVVPVSSS